MKKTIVFIITLVIVFAAAGKVYAASDVYLNDGAAPSEATETFETAETDDAASTNGDDIAENDGSAKLSDGTKGTGTIGSPSDWFNEVGYPDDISFAYEAGGEMLEDGTIMRWYEIGIVGATEERKKELSEMFADNCVLTFVDARYSYSEREAILSDIEMNVKGSRDDGYVYGMLVLNTENIYVVVKDDAFEEHKKEYFELYGDIVEVCAESEQATVDTVMTGGGMDTGASESHGVKTVLFIVGSAMILAALTLGGVKLIPVLASSKGDHESGRAVITRSYTEQAVKESGIVPRGGLFDDIRKRIDE